MSDKKNFFFYLFLCRFFCALSNLVPAEKEFLYPRQTSRRRMKVGMSPQYHSGFSVYFFS